MHSHICATGNQGYSEPKDQHLSYLRLLPLTISISIYEVDICYTPIPIPKCDSNGQDSTEVLVANQRLGFPNRPIDLVQLNSEVAARVGRTAAAAHSLPPAEAQQLLLSTFVRPTSVNII